MDENGVKRAVMDLKEAAAYLGVSYETARLYVAGGKLKAVRLPKADGEGRRRKIQVKRDELDRFLEECRW
jgi:excisionase family DNA binding protein